MSLGVITLTEGNINNSHLYLTDIMSLFPATAVGGPNESAHASKPLEIHPGFGAPVFTDIAGEKKSLENELGLQNFSAFTI